MSWNSSKKEEKKKKMEEKRIRSMKLSMHETTIMQFALSYYADMLKDSLRDLPDLSDEVKLRNIHTIQDLEMMEEVISGFKKIEIREDC